MRFSRLSRLSDGYWETVRNISWMGLERIVRMGGSLVVGTLMVRYLGPSQFGAYSYAFAIYGLFNVISNLGLDYLVVSDLALAKEIEREEEVLGTSFFLKFSAGVVTALAAIAYAWITHPKDTTVLIIVAMLSTAAIAQGFDVIDYFFQSKTRSRLTVLPQIGVFLMATLARLAAVFFKGSLLVFALIAALEILATQITLALVYLRHEKNLHRWRFRMERAVGLLRASWPLIIASLMVTIYMRTDQILLGTLSTVAAVGQYSAAVKLSEIWYAIPTIICASVMPRLLKYKQGSPKIYYARIGRIYGLMAVLSTVLALLVTFFGKYGILLLFGEEYLPAARILSVHIWTGPFVFLGVVSGMQLIHENLTHISLQRSIIGAVANVGLNYLLIPRYGTLGSAFATLCAQGLSSYLLDATNRSTWPIFRMKTAALSGFWLFQKKPLKPEPSAL